MANWATIANVGNPADPNWQKQNLTTISPVAGQSWQVYKPAADAFQGLIGDLVAEGYQPHSSGGFNYRNIRGGQKLSQHAFGTAIDINADENPRVAPGAALVTDLPANTADLAKKWGLEWGGTWHRPDAMHFEYTGGADNGLPTVSPSPLAGMFTGAETNAAPQPTAQPGVPATVQPSVVPQAPAAFGDVVAPQAPSSFGNVVANFLTSRQLKAQAQEADQERRNALLASVGSPFIR